MPCIKKNRQGLTCIPTYLPPDSTPPPSLEGAELWLTYKAAHYDAASLSAVMTMFERSESGFLSLCA